MSNFPLREMYEKLAMQISGKQLKKDMPFGPAFVIVHTKDGEIEHCEVWPPVAILPFFFSDEGPAALQKLIDSVLEKSDENTCVMVAHDAHIKIMEENLSPEVEEALTHRSLQNDAEAKRVILFDVYHRTGTLNGFLPLSDKLIVGYADPVEEMTVHRVKISATSTTH